MTEHSRLIKDGVNDYTFDIGDIKQAIKLLKEFFNQNGDMLISRGDPYFVGVKTLKHMFPTREIERIFGKGLCEYV